MAAPVVDAGVSALCPHGGRIAALATTPRARIAGQPVVRAPDSSPITGCPNQPTPCVRATFGAASRMSLGGAPVALATAGFCFDAAGRPTGPVAIVSAQVRVSAT